MLYATTIGGAIYWDNHEVHSNIIYMKNLLFPHLAVVPLHFTLGRNKSVILWLLILSST